MRLLAYSDSRVYSGAEIFFVRVLEDLARRPRLRVDLALAPENEELTQAATPFVDELLTVPSQPTRLSAFHLYDLRRRLAVRSALRRRNWDAMLVNLPTAEYGATPLLVRLPPETATLGLLHIHQRFAPLGFRAGALRDILARAAVRRLDGLAVLSPWAERDARASWLGEGTITAVVPMPSPRVHPVRKEVARAGLGLSSGQLVGIAGRISLRQKGFDTMAAAAAILAERSPDIRFAVAGTGPDEDALRALLKRHGLTDHFRLLGPVRPIEAFLGAVDAIAIPSRFEGIPLVALEALWTGTAGVATSIDGLAQLWPNEWQVPPDDESALAARLEAVLTTPQTQRSAVVAAARQKAEALVTDDLGPTFVNLLEELIQCRRPVHA